MTAESPSAEPNLVENAPVVKFSALFTEQPSVPCHPAIPGAWGTWTEIYRYTHDEAVARKFLFSFHVSAEASWNPTSAIDRCFVQYRCFTKDSANAIRTTHFDLTGR